LGEFNVVDSVVGGGAGAVDTLVAAVAGADDAWLCWLPKGGAAAWRSGGAQTGPLIEAPWLATSGRGASISPAAAFCS
jgi:hypothetical protein